MASVFLNAEELKRETSFPVKVSQLYICNWQRFPVVIPDYVFKQQQITLRYDSDSKMCMDTVNGKVMGIPFPNVIFKFPGMKIRIADNAPRSAVGFSYSEETIELLRSWGMFPKEPFLPLAETAELKRLLDEIHKFIRIYPAVTYPGDWLDSICFNILREIRFSRQEFLPENRSPEIRIQEIKLYFQQHYDEKLDLDAVAGMFGFSRASFYQHWKKMYHTTPHHYVDELKLRAAAFTLLRSNQPLSMISDELKFPGASSFYRKFRNHFHTSPAEFRRNREYWEKEIFKFFAE